MCPFMSCRIWEVIDQNFIDQFEVLKEEALTELLPLLELMKDDGVCEVPLTDEQIGEVIGDFNRACEHYILMFSIKFAWSRSLPWVIMSLCHPDLSKAWAWAKRIVEMYRDHRGPLDRRTQKYLHPSSQLRRMIDSFIETRQMHPILQLEVALFRFVPLSDRPAEAEHVWLKDVAKQQRGTRRGCKYSMAHRMSEIKQPRDDAATQELLIDKFLSLSSVKSCADIFDLTARICCV